MFGLKRIVFMVGVFGEERCMWEFVLAKLNLKNIFKVLRCLLVLLVYYFIGNFFMFSCFLYISVYYLVSSRCFLSVCEENKWVF